MAWGGGADGQGSVGGSGCASAPRLYLAVAGRAGEGLLGGGGGVFASARSAACRELGSQGRTLSGRAVAGRGGCLDPDACRRVADSRMSERERVFTWGAPRGRYPAGPWGGIQRERAFTWGA